MNLETNKFSIKKWYIPRSIQRASATDSFPDTWSVAHPFARHERTLTDDDCLEKSSMLLYFRTLELPSKINKI